MRQITLSEYNKISKDLKGVWTHEYPELPCWPSIRQYFIGKRTLVVADGKCTPLLIEGLSFEIVDDPPPKYSPGPWKLQPENDSHRFDTDWKTFHIITVPSGINEVAGILHAPAPHHKANAQLISAAPELLTMLQRLLDGVLLLPELPKTIAPLDIEQARAAIAKATGH